MSDHLFSLGLIAYLVETVYEKQGAAVSGCILKQGIEIRQILALEIFRDEFPEAIARRPVRSPEPFSICCNGKEDWQQIFFRTQPLLLLLINIGQRYIFKQGALAGPGISGDYRIL